MKDSFTVFNSIYNMLSLSTLIIETAEMLLRIALVSLLNINQKLNVFSKFYIHIHFKTENKAFSTSKNVS